MSAPAISKQPGSAPRFSSVQLGPDTQIDKLGRLLRLMRKYEAMNENPMKTADLKTAFSTLQERWGRKEEGIDADFEIRKLKESIASCKLKLAYVEEQLGSDGLTPEAIEKLSAWKKDLEHRIEVFNEELGDQKSSKRAAAEVSVIPTIVL